MMLNPVPPNISIIIPAKDAAQSIAACLAAITQQADYIFQKDYEVIVVDDGSTDDTAQIAKSWGVKVISQTNAGPASARNTGVQNSAGEFLAFTDADCVPAKNWLSKMLEPFRQDKVIGVKGAYRTNEMGKVPLFVQYEYEYKYQRMLDKPIDFIDTYSAAYRRHVFIENHGFNEMFRVPSVEDQEFSFRLARKGYRMVFQPEAIVYHRHDQTLREFFQRKFGIGYWKAVMLHWLPEKTMSDSHTSPSQRWQILLLALFLLTTLFIPFFPTLLPILIFPCALFYISASSFIRFIANKNRSLTIFAWLLIIIRSLSLGLGLSLGFLFPPKIPPKTLGLTITQRTFKRALDICGAIVGLVIFSPIILICAIAIRIESPGTILFSQERIGENGKPFRIYKLRTMISGAEKLVDQYIQYSHLDGPVFKIPGDPRVTRVGKFLRRWSLDELPQFWNILTGQMSLVGPRPEESWLVSQYNDMQRLRLIIKPGLTGLAQISGRGNLDMDSRLALDMEYIQNYSLCKDLQILLSTIPAIISGKGAY